MATVTFVVPANGDDAHVERRGSTWPPADPITMDSAYSRVRNAKSWNGALSKYQVIVGLFRWNTGSIPDDATVTAATARLSSSTGSIEENPERTIQIEWYTGAWDTSAWVLDPSTTVVASMALPLTADVWYTPALASPANVNKTGYTQLRLTVSGGGPPNLYANEGNFISRESNATTRFAELVATYNSPPTAPGTPTTASPARGTQRISWSASSDPEGDAITYDVELSMNNGSTWSVLATGVTTAYYDYNFSAQSQSTTAKLRVRAKDAGGLYSGYTTSTAFTVNDLPSAPTVTYPNGGEAVDGTVNITWNAASDNDVAASTLKYNVELSQDSGTSWSTIQSLSAAGATSLSYNFDSVPDGTTTLLVRVRAYDGIEYGPFDASDATFSKADATPTAPTLVSPSSGSTVDDSAPVTFDWTFNDPGDTQSAYYLRRKRRP